MTDKTIRLLAVVSFVSVVILALLAGASRCHAAPCPETRPIVSGEVATCDGVVFPHPWSIQCIQCVDVELPLEKQRTVLCHDEKRVLVNGWNRQRSAMETQIEKLEEIAREAAGIEKPWFENRWLWFGLGAATTGTLILLAR